jgi:DNA mismatch repair protein MutS2
VLYPQNFEEKTGFYKIRERIKFHCLSELGKHKADKIKFSESHRFISLLLSQVEEFVEILEMEEQFPLEHCVDMKASLERIKTEGAHMEVGELHDLRSNQNTIRKIISFFKQKKKDEKYLNLAALASNVTVYPYVTERIDRILTTKGEVKDNASADLKRIRDQIAQYEKQVSAKNKRILDDAKKKGIVGEDASLAIREGRAVIPVDVHKKRQINGLVQDESASGKTVFIEPAEIVEMNNQIRELKYSEKREIIRILAEFADDIRPYIDDLLVSTDFLGTIDFVRAKARFAREINGIKPAMSKEPLIRWYEAIHPLLFLAFKSDDRQVVPLDITLDQKQRILVISGPNAGGKSVCLQTVGLLQYMFQCGIPVPMKPGSEMGVFKNLFINIGDDQSIENDLSTYSSHLMNMKYFMRYSNKRSLVLIDEFGAGTEPMLGGAIAESILDDLNNKMVMGVITTHYSNLKHFASNQEGIENGAMLFDTDKMTPLYKLTMGEPGSSFAFEIAKKIGLPQEVLNKASDKVGKKHIDFDKNLKDIIRDKRYWEKKREQIKAKEKRLEKVLNDYSQQLKTARETKKEIKKEAKQEAEKILADVNKKIEDTIRRIKESNAEKEATKKARKDLEEFKKQKLVQDEGKLDQKIDKLEKEQKQLKDKLEINESKQESTKKEAQKIQKGDKVQLKNRDSVGEVLEVNDKSILVAFGNMMTTVTPDKLEKISESEYKKQTRSTTGASSQNFDLGKRKMEFNTELDIRGKKPDEALQLVRNFIDEAIMIGVGSVRILHGKGTGVLRQLVRQYLETVDVVEHFRDEHVDYGGAGITVVTFAY